MHPEIASTTPCDHFLNRIVEAGFGALSKKEFERLAFALLVDSGRITDVDKHFEISRTLKITISKARSLAYEYALYKFPRRTHEQLRQEFVKLLRVSRFGKSKDRVVLEIRDTKLREEIEEFIHTEVRGCAPDYSFNKNLLLIDFGTFSALVECLAGQAQMCRIEKELRKLKELPRGLPSGKALLEKFLEGAANRAGAKSVDLAGFLMTGGVSTVLG